MKFAKLLILLAITIPVIGDTGSDELSYVEFPDFLSHFPGLFVRENDEIIDAPDEDVALAMSYPLWEDRGKLITIDDVKILVN